MSDIVLGLGATPPEGTIRVPRGAALRILLPLSLNITELPTALPAVAFATNYPLDPATPFQRDRFLPLPSAIDAASATAIASFPVIAHAGTFDYRVTVTPGRETAGQFVVDPLPPGGHATLVVQTVLTKCLGPLSDWPAHFAIAAATGYNAIHFTPVSALGVSRSAYSLFDQSLPEPSMLSPAQQSLPLPAQWSAVDAALSALRSAHGIVPFVDVVWNHTACNAPFLDAHPEVGFNLLNSPHLVPAYILDDAIQSMSARLPALGLSPSVRSDADVDAIVAALREKVLPSAALYQFFVVDVEHTLQLFTAALPMHPVHTYASEAFEARVERLRPSAVIRSSRFGTTISLAMALQCFADAASLRAALDLINLPLYRQYDEVVEAAARSVAGTLRWERLDPNGPQLGPISAAAPLVGPYFTAVVPAGYTGPTDAASRIANPLLAERVLANSGWVQSNDLAFAEAGSDAYLRREVMIWGDSVKLRYGRGPADSPWLWAHMRAYTVAMARLFDGFRIDNCHSTPIHVARDFLDAARAVRPELFVFAELFTPSPARDAEYVSSLGLSALIREASHPHDTEALAAQTYAFAGRGIGSLPVLEDAAVLRAGTVPPLLFDCTHDNEMPAARTTAFNALPLAALSAMAACAVGSTRGFDTLVPRRVDVARDERRYSTDAAAECAAGIAPVKTALNRLHRDMAAQGLSEVYVHRTGDVVRITRASPSSHDGVLLIAHCSYGAGTLPVDLDVDVEAVLGAPLFAAHLASVGAEPLPGSIIAGLPVRLVFAADSLGPHAAVVSPSRLAVRGLPPGAVLALRLGNPTVPRSLHAAAMDRPLSDPDPALSAAAAALDGLALNVLLFRCAEEEGSSIGAGTYAIPGAGPLPYAGLQGWAGPLRRAALSGDLGCALAANLRGGDWAQDFTLGRLEAYVSRHAPALDSLLPMVAWLRARFAEVRTLPRHLVPRAFHCVVTHAVAAARRAAASLTAAAGSGPLSAALALTSFQLYGLSASGALRPGGGASLAAGLPHFAGGYMRCWGRDTFIALPGLFLATARWAEARDLLLAFAAVVRHGLVPNLLASSGAPRYNARDATWFWLQSVQEYCRRAPDGDAFLDTAVVRQFPSDLQGAVAAASVSMPLAEVVSEILSRHVAGIRFREWNAGTAIDSVMADAGFNIAISVDRTTGLVSGGNGANCGTWMDKNGSSAAAGNRGIPATPRDGAAIEINGLVGSAVRWAIEVNRSAGRERIALAGWSLAEWDAALVRSFDRAFYIPLDPAEDAAAHVDGALVQHRGMYRDSVGSSRLWTDYQLRPNAAVAMAVAPHLFDRAHAATAVRLLASRLAADGALGVRTLDRGDLQYRDRYDNSNDSADFTMAKGYSYHNGPPWVWPLGYLLRAMHAFGPAPLSQGVVAALLRAHADAITSSDWAGLPELTNGDGSECVFSCPTQAWSTSTLLDAVVAVRVVQ